MTKLMKNLGLEIPEWTGPVVVESAAVLEPCPKSSTDFKFLSKEEPLSHCNGVGHDPELAASLKQESHVLNSNSIAAKRLKIEPLPT